MKSKLLRNIFWIALIAVWTFLAGAYFNLGWVKSGPANYQIRFFLGGISLCTVFVVMGIFIYRFAKNNGNKDAAKPALGIVSFFTICFLLISWIKYEDVQKDRFVNEMRFDFVDHYQQKANAYGIKIDKLDDELEYVFEYISFDLKRHSKLDELMKKDSYEAIFEQSDVISNLCIKTLKTNERLGYPSPKGMIELFEK